MRTKIIGQIHDCLIASIPREELDEFCDLAVECMTKKTMQHWPSIVVELKTEAELCPEGISWAEKQVAKRDEKGRWKIPKR